MLGLGLAYLGNKVLKELHEENEKKLKVEQERKDEQVKEWRRKLNLRDRKEREVKERTEKERIIKENWELLKWSRREGRLRPRVEGRLSPRD